MIKNYIKIAFRNIFRNKIFSIINVLGLAVGLAVSVIILVYIKHELSYDKFHDNYKNTYRMSISQAQGENISLSAITSPAMGPETVEEMPEIKNFTRTSTQQSGTFKYNNESFETGSSIYADSTFFDVFSFKILVGDSKKVLNAPNSIVISKSLSKKIFKKDNPIGQQLYYHSDIVLTITGIFEDIPDNTHMNFNSVISFNTFSERPDFVNTWDGNFSYYTFVVLENSVNPDNLEAKLVDIFYEKLNKKLELYGWKILPFFEPLEDLYLRSDSLYQIKTGSEATVQVFIIIAVFLLLIAGINFMNLSTALIFKRVKEVAIRKVSGASKRKVVYQFLNESIIVSLFSLILALILIEIFLPGFNQMFNKNLSLYNRSNIILIIAFPAIAILIGIISGAYPAIIISGFKAVNLFKGFKVKGNSKFSIQNILVIVQFVISTVLIISTTVIYFQINFLTNKDLGYNKENLVVVGLYNTKSFNNCELLKERFLENSNVINSTIASAYPKNGLTSNGYKPEGYEQGVMFNALYVDCNYISTMGMEIVKGRDFNPEIPTDKEKLIVNETLAKEVGWDDPIGKYIERNGKQEIIGVVKDFHFASLHDKIAPLVITMYPRKSMIITKVKDENMQATLEYMEKQWIEITGDNSFNYFYLNESFENLYKADQNFGEIILSFSLLAIFIACLGLFGLTAFISMQRTKEIGIRKTLGASLLSINKLIIKEFIIIVLISLVFAWPIGYYAMNKWLQNYAYKIDLNIMYFILASVIAILVALLTLSYHSVKASKTNPIDSLKYE